MDDPVGGRTEAQAEHLPAALRPCPLSGRQISWRILPAPYVLPADHHQLHPFRPGRPADKITRTPSILKYLHLWTSADYI
jgi:hypothetical protein